MKLKDVSLDKLKTIHSLYETGSISASAQRLFVTPSAVSQSLAALESQLGNQLFVKRGKTLLPTIYCKKLISVYEPFQDSLTQFFAHETDEANLPRGELRVFIPIVAGNKLLSNPFMEFLNQNPGVTLTVESGSSENAIRALHANSYDFAICGIKKLIAQHKWCEARQLFELTMGLFCSKEFYKRNKTALLARDFSNLHFVSGYQNQSMLKWYFKETNAKSTRVVSRLNIYDMSFMTKAVTLSLGIGLLARELIGEELERGEIIQIDDKTLKHPMFLVHQKQKVLNSLEKAFMKQLVSYFKGSLT